MESLDSSTEARYKTALNLETELLELSNTNRQKESPVAALKNRWDSMAAKTSARKQDEKGKRSGHIPTIKNSSNTDKKEKDHGSKRISSLKGRSLTTKKVPLLSRQRQSLSESIGGDSANTERAVAGILDILPSPQSSQSTSPIDFNTFYGRS